MNIEKRGIVYKATNLINNKIYIGITSKSLEERRTAHLRTSNLKKPKYIFHKAIKKHGFANFVFEEIDTFSTEKEGQEKEIKYISDFNSFLPIGYNMTLGGEGVTGHRFHHTEEVKQKISLSCKGVRKSEKTKENMKKAQKKRNIWFKYIPSLETRKKISVTLQLNKRVYKPVSEETKNKIRQKLLGQKHSQETKDKRVLKLIGKKRTQEQKQNLILGKRLSFIKKIQAMPIGVFDEIKLLMLRNIKYSKISKIILIKFNYKIDKKTLLKRRDLFC